MDELIVPPSEDHRRAARRSSEQITRAQRRFLRELEQIAEIMVVDYSNIRKYEPAARTVYLSLMKNQLVRGFVVMKYALIDEFLASEICRYFFRPKLGFMKLWRTKRFRIFNYYVIEELSLLQKLRLVRVIRKIPKPIVADIERINALRNGLAHAFFPENLKKSPPIYKGKSIFELEGVQLFDADVQAITTFFIEEFYGRRQWQRWVAAPN